MSDKLSVPSWEDAFRQREKEIPEWFSFQANFIYQGYEINGKGIDLMHRIDKWAKDWPRVKSIAVDDMSACGSRIYLIPIINSCKDDEEQIYNSDDVVIVSVPQYGTPSAVEGFIDEVIEKLLAMKKELESK